jgi:rhodanese-related sulfurtransferase
MITVEDRKLVRKMARDAFGELLDLCEADKETLRKAMKNSQNVSLTELVIAAHEHEIDDNTRPLLKLKAEILQERMGDMMRASKEGEV